MHEYYLPEDYTAHVAWSYDEVEQVLDMLSVEADNSED